jgi:hypothetical protein
METRFDLIITADDRKLTAELRLLDVGGVQIGFQPTDFKKIVPSRRQGLFDLQNYMRLYVEPGREETAFAEIGVRIAEEVLGEEIFLKLWEPESPRTLCVQLPGAADKRNAPAAVWPRGRTCRFRVGCPSCLRPCCGKTADSDVLTLDLIPRFRLRGVAPGQTIVRCDWMATINGSREEGAQGAEETA